MRIRVPGAAAKPVGLDHSREDDETRFLNVDLDVFSRSHLEPLVAALGRKVSLNYVGGERGRYSAHLALANSHRKDADTLIRALAACVNGLPRAARKLWNEAQSREFNIGIQAGFEPRSYEIRIKTETLALVARLKGRIGVTTYAAERPSGRKKTSPR